MSNSDPQLTPAIEASELAFSKIVVCIETKASFIINAGAGSGKTYSLVRALNYLISKKSKDLSQSSQRIACITFTNIAKEEIRKRTDSSPLILAETIHSFAWEMLKNFQSSIRSKLMLLENWQKKVIEEEISIANQIIGYEMGYSKIDENQILLSHDDVIQLFALFLSEKKFRMILKQKYPVIFIDEYQDTNKDFISGLVEWFVNQEEGLLLGFFGDPWQKIYGSNACGEISHPKLIIINKHSNFRSVQSIVDVLNSMRAELPQVVSNPGSQGDVRVFITNNWNGERRKEAHWKEDLPAAEASCAVKETISLLSQDGWDVSSSKLKILMLTHNVLASEQGYKNLSDAFDRTESFIKREDALINYFSNVIEPACKAFLEKKYGEMFASLGLMHFTIKSLKDKEKWSGEMSEMCSIRVNGTIGDALDFVLKSKLIRVPKTLIERDMKLKSFRDVTNLSEEDQSFHSRMLKVRAVPYRELSAVTDFVNEMTPFATQHGVKGAEYDNVLVVLGRGWNQYNFNQMLEWWGQGVPKGKQESFERSRNLFYVSCSRPKKNLALLFTQELSPVAINQIESWFGKDKVQDLY